MFLCSESYFRNNIREYFTPFAKMICVSVASKCLNANKQNIKLLSLLKLANNCSGCIYVLVICAFLMRDFRHFLLRNQFIVLICEQLTRHGLR